VNLWERIQNWRIARLEKGLDAMKRDADLLEIQLHDAIADCHNFDRLLAELRSGSLGLEAGPMDASPVSLERDPSSSIA
jgi:hypothetical protein